MNHRAKLQSTVHWDGGGGSSKRCNTTVRWSLRCFRQRAKPPCSSQRGPSSRRGRAPAALSQGVSVTSKPAVSLRDAFLVRTKQSVAVSQRGGGKEGDGERSHALQPQWPHCSNSAAEGPQEPLTKRVSLPAHRELLEEW